MKIGAVAKNAGIRPSAIRFYERVGVLPPAFRKSGVAKNIKKRIFDLSREKYPESKIFGLTTGLAVMKINFEMGYEPVTYSELTQDEAFWAGCKSCVNYDILMSKDRQNCMCTAMLYDPQDHYTPQETADNFKQHSKLYERFMKIKQGMLEKLFSKKETAADNGSGNGGSRLKSLFHYFHI